MWGEDANEWKPERFLEEKAEDDEKTRLGMIGNLYEYCPMSSVQGALTGCRVTFSSGVRGRIG